MAASIADLERKLNSVEAKLNEPPKPPQSEIPGKVLVGVITAVVLGALALAWNWGTQGGLVRVLGGVTKDEFDAALKKFTSSTSEANSDVQPRGEVVAFDLPNGCPSGWSIFERGISRAIIGASPLHTAEVPNFDAQGQRLMPHLYQADGGSERHLLTIAEMPSHQHGVYPHAGYIPNNSSDANGPGAGSEDKVPPLRVVMGLSTPVGGGQPFQIMPPFVSLFFCKKD